jgi:hypothetical protein
LAGPTAGYEKVPVAFVADNANAWESYRLNPCLEVDAGSRQRIEAAEALFTPQLSAESFRAAIQAGSTGANRAALDAALCWLATSELDRLTMMLRDDAALRQALATLYNADPWANVALPGLVAWLDRREPSAALPRERGFLQRLFRRRPAGDKVASTMAAAKAPDEWRQNIIGPELDVLSLEGVDGSYVTLPFACNARLRRQAKADQGVCVIATCRNEGLYLLEWIAYYRMIGVDHFFLYSNDNEDGSDAVLAALSRAGIITWFNNKIAASSGANAQIKAYGHALNVLPETLGYRWALIVDLDEFLVLDQSRVPNLLKFVEMQENHASDSIAINWQFMAAERGSPETGLLTRRCRRVLGPQQIGDGARLVKSMSRPSRIIHSEAHVPFAEEREGLITRRASGALYAWHNPPPGWQPNPKFADAFCAGLAVVNHYISKSPEEWLWKCARNRGDHLLVRDGAVAIMDQSSSDFMMLQLDTPDLPVDDRIVSNSVGLDAEIAQLRSLPGMAEAVKTVIAAYAARLQKIRVAYAAAPEILSWGERGQRFLALAGVRAG